MARGKFSEGENFNGALCRGVIIIGIPNLNLNSPKYIYLIFDYYDRVLMKKEFLTKK